MSSYILEDRKRYVTIDRRNKYVVSALEMRGKIYGIEIGFVQGTIESASITREVN